MVRVGLWQWCCCCLAAEVLLLLLRTRLEDLQEDTGATAECVDIPGGVRRGIDGCGSVYEAGGHWDVREGRVDEAVPYLCSTTHTSAVAGVSERERESEWRPLALHCSAERVMALAVRERERESRTE